MPDVLGLAIFAFGSGLVPRDYVGANAVFLLPEIESYIINTPTQLSDRM
jgi:hypothetical protein